MAPACFRHDVFVNPSTLHPHRSIGATTMEQLRDDIEVRQTWQGQLLPLRASGRT